MALEKAAGAVAGVAGATSSYKDPLAYQLFIYDLVVWIFSIAFDCFFREIRTRGGFRIPNNPRQLIIFVLAPHANQFVDGLLLLNCIQKASKRRISFLVLAKSYKDPIIGMLANGIMSIPVARAQDNLKAVPGKIRYHSNFDAESNLTLVGEGTRFTRDAQVNGIIALPRSMGSSEVLEIVSDTELVLKRDFKIANPKHIDTLSDLLRNGTEFKTADKIDQSEVYAKVFDHLSHGHCLGIYPEGGSHDRPDLLPLKLGVAVMALGAMANDPKCNVKIVPCGMNYFMPHKFRSRAVVEFGDPLEIKREWVEMYRDPKTSKDAVRELLDEIKHGLKLVTVTCPDYETLVCVQVARRLYSNNLSARLSLPLVVEMNRRLVKGYSHFQDEPRLQLLRRKILQYHELLKIYHIPDHEVEKCQPRLRVVTFALLLLNFSRALFLSFFCIPGFLLFSPIFIASKRISTQKSKALLAASTVKVKATDVIATWKILVSMCLAPLLYFVYSCIGSSLLWYYSYISGFKQLLVSFAGSYLFCSMITYCALIIGDKGNDYYKSLRPLYFTLINENDITQLKQLRRDLTLEITELVNELGPQLFPDFDLLQKQDKLQDLEEDLKTEKLKLRKLDKLNKKQKLKDEFSGINRLNSAYDLSSIPIFSTDKSSDVEMTSISSANVTSDLTSTDGEGDSEDQGHLEISQKIRERIISDNRKRDDEQED